MRPSEAATWGDQLTASTAGPSQDTDATLALIVKAQEICGKPPQGEPEKDVNSVFVKLGQDVMEPLSDHIKASQNALLGVQRLQKNWTNAPKQTTEEVQALDSSHKILQETIEEKEERIANLEELTSRAQQDLDSIQADLRVYQVHLENTRLIDAALDASNKEGMTTILGDRMESLRNGEVMVQKCFHRQEKWESELASALQAQNERESQLRESEATAAQAAEDNHRDRVAIEEALAALRPIAKVLNLHAETGDTVTGEAKTIAGTIKTEVLNLNYRLQEEQAKSEEQSQNIERWRITFDEHVDLITTLESDVRSKNDVITRHLQTIHDQNDQIDRQAGSIQVLQGERDELQVEIEASKNMQIRLLNELEMLGLRDWGIGLLQQTLLDRVTEQRNRHGETNLGLLEKKTRIDHVSTTPQHQFHTSRTNADTNTNIPTQQQHQIDHLNPEPAKSAKNLQHRTSIPRTAKISEIIPPTPSSTNTAPPPTLLRPKNHSGVRGDSGYEKNRKIEMEPSPDHHENSVGVDGIATEEDIDETRILRSSKRKRRGGWGGGGGSREEETADEMRSCGLDAVC
ncbi:MAG: hypothetical protein Q9186_006733 [Xanthomendoza sp. 1 TL-2023]